MLACAAALAGGLAAVPLATGGPARAAATCGTAVTRQTTDDRGITHRVTTDSHGVPSDQPVWPIGFDPTKATDAQLEEYGLPPRPKNPAELATWNDYLSPARHVTQALTPLGPETQEQVANDCASHPVMAPSNGYYQSTAWSGMTAAPFTGTYSDVEGTFFQTGIDSCPNPPGTPVVGGTSAGCSTGSWVGVGGTGYYVPLIQAGVVVNTLGAYWVFVEANPNGGKVDYYAQYGVCGLDNCPGPNSKNSIAPGHHIWVDVYWNNTYNEPWWWVYDITTGLVYGNTGIGGGSLNQDWNSSTASWIDERPSSGQQFQPMSLWPWHNKNIYWDGSSATDPSVGTLGMGGWNTYGSYLTNYGNTYNLAAPAGYGSDPNGCGGAHPAAPDYNYSTNKWEMWDCYWNSGP